jgi:hypothetical protein
MLATMTSAGSRHTRFRVRSNDGFHDNRPGPKVVLPPSPQQLQDRHDLPEWVANSAQHNYSQARSHAFL